MQYDTVATYQTYRSKLVSHTASKLVVTADGSCGAWADLFKEVLATQGIPSSVRKLLPNPQKNAYAWPLVVPPQNVLALFIRGWTWDTGDGDPLVVTMPFTWRMNPTTVPTVPQSYWENDPQDPRKKPNVAEDGTVQAQGTGGKRIAAWRNHFISLYVDRTSKKHYYDPSFGKGSHESVSAWESEALGTGQANTGGYSLVFHNKLRVRADPANKQVKEVDP